jgi:20S proteasome subunit beta 2
MPGFDFSNYNRNAALHARGVPLPKATSTGTTIVGCIYDGGVVVWPFGVRSPAVKTDSVC